MRRKCAKQRKVNVWSRKTNMKNNASWTTCKTICLQSAKSQDVFSCKVPSHKTCSTVQSAKSQDVFNCAKTRAVKIFLFWNQRPRSARTIFKFSRAKRSHTYHPQKNDFQLLKTPFSTDGAFLTNRKAISHATIRVWRVHIIAYVHGENHWGWSHATAQLPWLVMCKKWSTSSTDEKSFYNAPYSTCGRSQINLRMKKDLWLNSISANIRSLYILSLSRSNKNNLESYRPYPSVKMVNVLRIHRNPNVTSPEKTVIIAF